MENLIPKILKIWLLMGSSAGKESTCNVGDLDLIPGLGRSPGCLSIFSAMDIIYQSLYQKVSFL